MNFLESEYLAKGLAARWLDVARAKNAYDYAIQFDSNDHYGLHKNTVEQIEHLVILSYSVTDAWLKKRLSAEGSVQIVYGPNAVCVMATTEFLAKWQDIFMPGRDDALVLQNEGLGVLFYCHEQEFEFGYRKEIGGRNRIFLTEFSEPRAMRKISA